MFIVWTFLTLLGLKVWSKYPSNPLLIRIAFRKYTCMDFFIYWSALPRVLTSYVIKAYIDHNAIPRCCYVAIQSVAIQSVAIPKINSIQYFNLPMSNPCKTYIFVWNSYSVFFHIFVLSLFSPAISISTRTRNFQSFAISKIQMLLFQNIVQYVNNLCPTQVNLHFCLSHLCPVPVLLQLSAFLPGPGTDCPGLSRYGPGGAPALWRFSVCLLWGWSGGPTG